MSIARRLLLPKPRSAAADAWRILWTTPLAAVPFAGFFMVVMGGSDRQFWGFFLVSLVFGVTIRLAVWAHEWFLYPRLGFLWRDERTATFRSALSFTAASMIGSLLAAWLIDLYLLPGFMGTGRAIATILLFALLFAVIFLLAGLAYEFHRRAVERAGSERELQLARRIQESFLLSQFPQRPRLEVHAANLSSKQVSGDFYDVVNAGEDVLWIVVADVSGKGVPAALLSSMLQASLRTQVGTGRTLVEMVTRLNALVCQRAATGQFATLFLASISEPDLTLRWVNAGHNPPVLQRSSGQQVLLETGGLVVGMLEGIPYQQGELTLAEGDRLVLYTDGVSEGARADGEMFGEDRLYALIAGLPANLGAPQQVDRIIGGLRAFLAGTEPQDDVTVMVVRVDTAPGAP